MELKIETEICLIEFLKFIFRGFKIKPFGAKCCDNNFIPTFRKVMGRNEDE